MRFTKMHGAGNDYVYVDGFRDTLPPDPAHAARFISDRHFGVGADGLILICPEPQDASVDARMRMFNADGSESEMCGNGIRCVAKYLFDHGISQKPIIRIATGDGIKELEVFAQDGVVHEVRVDMGLPLLAAEEIPTLIQGDPAQGNRVVNVPIDVGRQQVSVTCVSMGNPHCVIFIDDLGVDTKSSADMHSFVQWMGTTIENDPRFPQRVNVEFVSVLSPNEVRQWTWERGSGETMACGTGASAVCVAGVLNGHTRRALQCRLNGGTLQLEWDVDTNHVFMTGPAVEVFQGEIDVPAAE